MQIQQMEELTESWISLPHYKRKIKISRANVVYLEGDGNYTRIYYQSAAEPLQCITVSTTLRLWEVQLSDFIRISKQSLINPDHLRRLVQLEDGSKQICAEMSTGHCIPISRRRIEVICEHLNLPRRYLGYLLRKEFMTPDGMPNNELVLA
jgi:DNA-binding LytR/AlgR family response regulator